MYAVLVAVMHAMVSSAAAFAIAPHSVDPTATTAALWDLCIASAAISATGFVATTRYLSKRIRPVSGAITGLLCGALCSANLSLAIEGIDFSLILYLAILAPALLAVLLASLLDGSKSGWQS